RGAAPLSASGEGRLGGGRGGWRPPHDSPPRSRKGGWALEKPILIYWLQAASVGTFGFHEWSFRLPSALAASGWLMAVVLFARRFLDERTALIAAALSGTAFRPLLIGRAATADALLNLCLAAALSGGYPHSVEPAGRPLIAALAWMAVGMLTKGPIALLIPALASGIYFATRRQLRDWLRAMLDPLGWLVLLAIAAPWYILEFRQQGAAFID